MMFRLPIRTLRPPPPEVVIISPLSPAECHRALTGKDKPRWLGDKFLKLLQLNGTLSTNHLSVRLPSSNVTGSIAASGLGTRIELWASGATRYSTIKGDAAVTFVVWTPLVALSWWLEGAPDLPVVITVAAMILGPRWYRELRLSWPDYPATPSELADMLAAHLQGEVRKS